MRSTLLFSVIALAAGQASAATLQSRASSYVINAFVGRSCPPVGTYATDDNADKTLASAGDTETGCYTWYTDITAFRPWVIEENAKRVVIWGDDHCASAESMGEIKIDKTCITAPADTPFRAFQVFNA